MGFNIIDCALFSEIANRCSKSQKNMQSCLEEEKRVKEIDNLIENKVYKLDFESDAECLTFSQKNKPNIFHIIFIGTNSKEDWYSDIDFIPMEINDYTDFKIHRGMYYQFMNLYPYLKNKIEEFFNTSKYLEHEIIISGHSLGGGLAIIAAVYFYHWMIEIKKSFVKFKIITIGAPRVLNKKLADWYNKHLSENTFRVINHFDCIPNLPLKEYLFKYTHVNSIIIYIKNNTLINKIPQRFLFDRIISVWYNFETHGIDSYVQKLKLFEILNSTEIC